MPNELPRDWIFSVRGSVCGLRHRNPDWSFVYSDDFALQFSRVSEGSRQASSIGRSVDQRADVASDLAVLLIPKQEPDGCWWDYPLYDYHGYYGTAFAVRSLQHCLDAM